MIHQFFAGVVLAAAAALPSPNPTLPLTYIEAPKAVLRLETATTPQQQERGLMSRTNLWPRTGMLFVFSKDAPISFWMKDTLIPLDMVFVGSDLRVRKVFARVPIVPPGMPDRKIPLETARAKYVIELPSGEATRDGIVPGVQLRIVQPPRC